MKDNRSLEQKIRKLVHESNRNTELRKKEPNVGRPTGDNKLAKQGQIKTKIIDEDSEYGMARNELETAKRAIDRLNAKMGKGEGELEAWVQAKITKASDYLDTVADYIESGSVKEEAIEEDTAVASVSTKDTPKEQPEPKNKKKDDGKDLMEPGTIKGGKTEVDLEPTTDDRSDDGKKINKNEKATKAANAHAGVKEETMNTTKHFGLPADLIAAVTEALKGGQKKLDKNHNGKIDGQDFKILRKEEVVDEERMSKGRRDALARKTSFTADPPRRLEKPEPKETKSDKIKAYRADRDKHMEEEVEAVDEASNAANKIKKGEYETKVGTSAIADKDNEHGAWGRETIRRGLNPDVAKRHQGRLIAKGRSTNNMHQKGSDVVRKEEVELSAEELARIEEIHNNLDEVVTARKLTAADKAARAKYLAGHKAKMASYAPHEVKGSAKSFKDRNSEPGDYTKEPSQMHKTGLLNVLTKQDTKVSK